MKGVLRRHRVYLEGFGWGDREWEWGPAIPCVECMHGQGEGLGVGHASGVKGPPAPDPTPSPGIPNTLEVLFPFVQGSEVG